MPHHYTKNTVSATVFCRTCNTMTQHYVWDGRLGRCMNDHPHAAPKEQPKQEPESIPQLGLFTPERNDPK